MDSFQVGQVDLDSLVDLLDVLGSRVWVDLMDILGLMADWVGIELVPYSMDNFHLVGNFRIGQVDSDILVDSDSLVDLDMHHRTDNGHLLANHKFSIEHSNEFQYRTTAKLNHHDRTYKIYCNRLDAAKMNHQHIAENHLQCTLTTQ